LVRQCCGVAISRARLRVRLTQRSSQRHWPSTSVALAGSGHRSRQLQVTQRQRLDAIPQLVASLEVRSRHRLPWGERRDQGWWPPSSGGGASRRHRTGTRAVRCTGTRTRWPRASIQTRSPGGRAHGHESARRLAGIAARADGAHVAARLPVLIRNGPRRSHRSGCRTCPGSPPAAEGVAAVFGSARSSQALALAVDRELCSAVNRVAGDSPRCWRIAPLLFVAAITGNRSRGRIPPRRRGPQPVVGVAVKT
jgi:hypothetical protein